MRFLVATNNTHKFREIRELMPEKFELVNQVEFKIPSPKETGLTFIENALIKARHASIKSGLPAIADDSGLAVEALGGGPGIYSSRFGGPTATDNQNTQKLLKELEGNDNRAACFHCVVVLVRNEFDPVPLVTQGILKGEILITPKGKKGFGYDSIFFLPDIKKTVAELDIHEKNKLSHRAEAVRQLVRMIQ